MNPLFLLALAAGGIALLARGLRSEPPQQPKQKPVETPRAFISFDFDNNRNDKVLFAGQCSKRSPTPFAIQDWSSKEPLPQREWQDIILEKIGRCHIMFVLVGPTAHRAAGVAKEIEMAVKQNVPFVGVYVAGADDSTVLPAGLSRARTFRWEWKQLAKAIESMLREGKNAQ